LIFQTFITSKTKQKGDENEARQQAKLHNEDNRKRVNNNCDWDDKNDDKTE